MTVMDVWGLVNGHDAGRITRDGEQWYFSLPQDANGDIPCEFWAEDEAGNVGYSAAVLSVSAGGVKCIRWIRTDGECTMKALNRPVCEILEPSVTCSMRPIACPCSEG